MAFVLIHIAFIVVHIISKKHNRYLSILGKPDFIMKIKLYPKALFRVPQFPTNAILEECWPALKLSIKDASTYFFNAIKDLEYRDIEAQPVSIKRTIEKYFNRAKFRSTPYGTFASIGTVPISDTEAYPIVIPGESHIVKLRDWSLVKEAKDKWKDYELDELYLQANMSYYRFSDSIRYIYNNMDKFELSEIPYYPEVFTILENLKESKTLPRLEKHLPANEFTPDELRELIVELIEYQLIITDKHPAIISDKMEFLNAEPDAEEKSYKIGVQKPVSGVLSQQQLNVVTETLNYLNRKRLSSSNNKELEDFIIAFQKRYDQQAVPIMEALDPILGIGYGSYAKTDAESDLLRELINAKQETSESPDKIAITNRIYAELLKKERKATIQLEELNLPDKAEDNHKLPNTFSALIKITGDIIQLNQVGGTTANALLGRFTIADNSVYEQCQALAAIEQQANPDILFFDVAYSGEPDIDNINRRKLIYEHTLSIHNYSEDSTIDIQDIILKVVGSELMLFSQKMQKRLMPRIATAYNYGRSDLPLFRLLCDLQGKGMVTSLKPELQTLLPDLEYRPRLQYRNVIISLRSWLLKYDDNFELPSHFKDYIHNCKVDRYLQVGSGDQTLRIDIESPADRVLLVSILKLRKELWAEEYIQSDRELVQDGQGNPFVSEIVLSYYYESPVYTSLPLYLVSHSDQRNFYPGSEWLYFEIYAHPQVLDKLLIEQIPAIMEEINDKIKGWFYIRYNEGGDHLRLRILQQNKAYTGELIQTLFHSFAPYRNTGLISDIKICTYTRELERYAYAGMDLVEEHFCHDTALVLDVLKNGFSTDERYKLLAICMLDIGTQHFAIVRFMEVIRQIKSKFGTEHNLQKQHHKKINIAFEKWHKQTKTLFISNETDSLKTQFEHSFLELLKSAGPLMDATLFGDLLHMHINRMFPEHQRTHELIFYEYLFKQSKAREYALFKFDPNIPLNG
ncbi:thiopeptide-type bacteriocin biosynthesis protein [Sphingobacterium faecium]|nr:thiopeptide-type bacteriocin biosynthesis protein [Sphingobacterium faecium]